MALGLLCGLFPIPRLDLGSAVHERRSSLRWLSRPGGAVSTGTFGGPPLGGAGWVPSLPAGPWSSSWLWWPVLDSGGKRRGRTGEDEACPAGGRRGSRSRPGLPLRHTGTLPARGFHPVFLATWGFAAYLVARGLRGIGRSRRALVWVMAGLLGSTAALPSAWGTQVQARMAEAEASSGTWAPRRTRISSSASTRWPRPRTPLSGLISSPVELLYEIWASTGAGRRSPPHVDHPLVSRRTSPRKICPWVSLGRRPEEVDDFLEEAREGGVPVIRHLGLADARYVLLVPLDGGRVLSAMCSPERVGVPGLGPGAHLRRPWANPGWGPSPWCRSPR